MKSYKKLVILATLLCTITGCVHYTELNELEVVENLSIDFVEDTYCVVASTLEKKEEITRNITKGCGKTLEIAMQNIKVKENKKLYIAHLNLLLITENVYREHLKEVLEFFLNNTDSRNDFDIALTKNANILEQENIEDLAKMIKTTFEDTATTKPIILEEFLKELLEEESTHLPVLEIEQESIRVSGIVIIKGKELIPLSEEETSLYNIVNNSCLQATIDKNRVLSNQTRISMKNEQLKIEIESMLSKENQEYEKMINEKITKMFEKYKNENIDIFHLKQKIKQKNPTFLTKYANYLEKIQWQIDVKVKNTTKTNRRLPE